MKNKFLLLTILGIFLLGVVLRFYRLDQFPPQLNRDEAALALNGLYIMQGGMDEWGERLPLQFKSFGDYKLPGYVYLLSVLFRFGQNDFLVRLPAAIAGCVLILATPIWIREQFKRKLSNWSYLFIALSIAVTPFAFFYSRMACEANLGLALMVTSLALLHAQTPTWKKDIVATLLYLAAVFTYNSPLLLLPCIILTLPVLRGPRSYKKWIYPTVLLSMVFVGTLLTFSQNNAQKSRILFMNDPNVLSAYPEYRAALPTFIKPLLGSQPAYFTKIAIEHYRDTFLPNFLILKGGQHPWHSILGRGHIYWVTYVLMLVGLVSQLNTLKSLLVVVKKKTDKHVRGYLTQLTPLYLLLISPLPAIFTSDAPHATRSLFTFVMIVVMAGIGITTLFKAVKRFGTSAQYGVVGLVFLLLFVESYLYVHQYFIEWPKDNFSSDFHLDFGTVLQEGPRQHVSGNVGIIDLGWYPYVTLSWYQRIPLETALTTTEREGPDTVGLYRVKKVDRYYFVYTESDVVPDQQWIINKNQLTGNWEMNPK